MNFINSYILLTPNSWRLLFVLQLPAVMFWYQLTLYHCCISAMC